MTADALKSIPKGNFVAMKTGTHPMKTKLPLFLDWGITFGKPYTIEEKSHRKVHYADKQTLEMNILRRHQSCVMAVDTDIGEILEPPRGTGALHTPVADKESKKLNRTGHVKS